MLRSEVPEDEIYEKTMSFQMGVDQGLPITLSEGFSSAETSHRWTEGKNARLEIPLYINNYKVEMVYFDTQGLVSEKISQTMTVSIEDKVLQTYKYDLNNCQHTVCIDISDYQANSVVVHFHLPNACKPVMINSNNTDARELAVSFRGCRIMLTLVNFQDSCTEYRNGELSIVEFIDQLKACNTSKTITAPTHFNPVETIKVIARDKYWLSMGTGLFGSKIPDGVAAVSTKSSNTVQELAEIINDRIAKWRGSYFPGKREHITSEFYTLILKLGSDNVEVPICFEAINQFCQKWGFENKIVNEANHINLMK